ncbi:MAG: PTS system mannitol-specific IIA component [Erysipelotrichaceae bacterium]|nr:MAG: PTS system mannitol-specific IIA [Erysipelotrichaceae bacterium]TXT19180.1 MAG: PTS system mannitol-specific IIA component [Erysipelotrichaceae bacterium]
MRIPKIIVICDAGMGSSALGASLLKKELKKNGLIADVSNASIDDVNQYADIIVTHHSFVERMKKHYPKAQHFGLMDFITIDNYRKVIDKVKQMTTPAVLLKENIKINCPTVDSDTAIVLAGQNLLESGYVQEKYIQGMLERDHSLSVFMGNYIALPHGEYEYKQYIKTSGIVVHIYPQGIDWHGEVVKLVVGLAGQGEDHMIILSNIATVFSEEEDVLKAITYQNVDEIYALLTQEE